MEGVLKCHGFEIQFMASNENNDCKEISLHISGSQVIAKYCVVWCLLLTRGSRGPAQETIDNDK